MNKIIRPLAAAFALAGLFVAQSASAGPLSLTSGDQIKLTETGGANGDPWRGGEFLASGVAVAQGPGDPFFTFCVEYSEEFNLGQPYYVNINTGAVGGGLSNLGTYPGDINGTTGFDPLSPATAWLYTQFMTNPGDSAGLGYDMSGSNTRVSSINQPRDDALQLAIWYLEGELSSNYGTLQAYNGNTLAQDYVYKATHAGWTNIGNVRVLNLYSGYSGGNFTGPAQDQLYFVPEPASLALLGLGLAGLAFARRRVRKNAQSSATGA